MGCGDSKDRKTVQAKSQVPAQSASRPVHVPEEPDEESEVLARARKLDTIEERLPAPIPPDEDVPEKPVEVTQITEPGEVRPQGVKFKGGESAVEALEVLEASLNELVPEQRRETEERAKNSHVDDLLEDVLAA